MKPLEEMIKKDIKKIKMIVLSHFVAKCPMCGIPGIAIPVATFSDVSDSNTRSIAS